jgi:hypothetical protein
LAWQKPPVAQEEPTGHSCDTSDQAHAGSAAQTVRSWWPVQPSCVVQTPAGQVVPAGQATPSSIHWQLLAESAVQLAESACAEQSLEARYPTIFEVADLGVQAQRQQKERATRFFMVDPLCNAGADRFEAPNAVTLGLSSAPVEGRLEPRGATPSRFPDGRLGLLTHTLG